jgi:hypothetical protein
MAPVVREEIELPAEMKRAMAKQAEAERERRAMIINSQGELAAAENLMRAADLLSRHRGALHLRTLQTIRDIAADPSEKIILVLPESLSGLAQTVAGNGHSVITPSEPLAPEPVAPVAPEPLAPEPAAPGPGAALH